MFYSEKFADFITKLNFNDIPQNVIQRAKELMLDSLGTALAVHKEECVLNALSALKTSGDTVAWGQKEKIDAINATMINTIASHALDFDDTHTEAILHASAFLTPL